MAFQFRNKIPKVKFYGALEDQRLQNSKTDNIVSKRLIGLIILTACFIVILIARLAIIQFSQGDELAVKLDTYGSTTYTSDSPRGEIYDRNYTKLVANENVICVNYYAAKSLTTAQRDLIVNYLTETIQLDQEKNTITERNKKDYFIMAYKDVTDALVSEEERAALEGDDNATKTINSMIIERITMDLVYQYMTDDDIERTRFEYLIKNCTSGSVVLAEGITIEEASRIGENVNILTGIEVSTDWSRQYVYGSQFRSVLGRVTTKKEGLPSDLKEELLALGYQNNSRVGTSGLEIQYEDILRGDDSTYTISYDSDGNPIRTNKTDGSSGDSIRLSVDWELQQFADTLIENELKAANSLNKYFERMFFVMMDPQTGEVLVMSGKQINKETGEVSDLSSGNYTSSVKVGSTIKAGTLYTAFKENIIVPNTYFVDEPIYLKGTPAKKSYRNMGNINEIDAMALSSNVYMFRIAMKLAGVDYVPNGALNVDMETFVKTITTMRRNLGELGLGVKTGLDVPNEALGYRGSTTQRGLLLDQAIGQYDTYTPIQLAQYTATLANGGIKVQPHLLLDSFITTNEGNRVDTYIKDTEVLDDVTDQATAFERIKLGMRACVTRSDGTSHSYWSSKPYVAYCKTGTAEDYDPNDPTDYPNHLQIGYISASEGSEPIVSFACVTVRQSHASTGSDSSAPYIANQIVDKYVEKYGLN